jgi:uncharacterized protein (TIGR00299 family) protein
MCLGALVGAGGDFKALKAMVEGLGLRGVSLKRRSVRRAGLKAVKIDVVVDESAEGARKLKDVERIVSRAKLPPRARERSLKVFKRIFRAEARVHGGRASEVHLHEMGAADIIVDVVGTVYLLEALGVGRVVASPVAVGSGSVKTAHGLLPVPAPAAVELLKGVPVTAGAVKAELATPTGAAIISELASGFGPMPDMKLLKTGMGAGSRDHKASPNVLRVMLGESTAAAGSVTVIEANIDDMTPEALAYAAEEILGAGALDVFVTPALMKKGRPGFLLTVLAKDKDSGRLSEMVLTETTSIGLRQYQAARRILEREVRKVRTKFGVIRVKDVYLHGRLLRSAPEYEDCARAARKHKKPLMEVMRACGE